MTAPEDIAQTFLWTALTIAAYALGLVLRRWTNNNPLANPALVAIVLMATMLLVTGTPYPVYFRATWLLTFLLGPATVALGVPLAKNLARVRLNWRAVTLSLSISSLLSMVSGVLIVRWLHGSNRLALSMLSKGVTTPIAMAVSEQIGGEPALTAALAIVGGIIAAVTLSQVFAILKVTDLDAIGLAAGTAGSGIAAAQVAPMGDRAAAFAAVGIGLNGLLTALVAPLLARFFH